MIAPALDVQQIARDIRRSVVTMSHAARAPHLAPALSCVDILVAAYWLALRIDPHDPANPARDRLIFSKGHAVSALYATLAHRGLFPIERLSEYGRHGGTMAEQPIPFAVPGVELATGSLGHGLPVGVGIALAARITGLPSRVLVVMGDGECNEGSVWEAAMFVPAHRLNHLTVVVDFNRWQGTGRSEDVLALQPLAAKWSAFGWRAVEVDGHDIHALAAAMQPTVDDPRPTAIIAHTVKGKGVSFMEDDNNWHYRVPDDDERRRAMVELGKRD